MTTDRPRLRSDEPLAAEFTAVIKAGKSERLRELLASDPRLALCVVEDHKSGGRPPLHLLADWPGHNPNAAETVQILAAAGADLDAPAVAMWHQETALHWAASSDDVTLIDALLDAGADIDHDGSSIDGGPPLSSAVGYGQWAAARRLAERGARTQLWHEAALGLMPELTRRLEADPALETDELSGAFWNACHGGQLATARYLLERGADLNWLAPWTGQTPLDIAEKAERHDIAAWLRESGATRGEKSDPDAV
ncbi:hypothetical protein AS156_07690 [Bradyrhizobium macuxiense]|uniref:Uncharacterized protein n=1 Tax=Bradyrhizobium macuxiense TaxID=1755647 RepID=A0A109JS13_9BRAD|nr:ankyrin repeat domain-containing protein [Bradyrhizobium macuxiense]KWV54102.1 hypothetical protein AS156_07690 [Bradyrhizobium macuxiense]